MGEAPTFPKYYCMHYIGDTPTCTLNIADNSIEKSIQISHVLITFFTKYKQRLFSAKGYLFIGLVKKWTLFRQTFFMAGL